MQKLFIKNRKNQKISVIVEKNSDQKGLVFIMHGIGGRKEEKHITTFAKAFLKKEFTVIRFDTTNSVGESDGKYEDATTTNYYEDLEDVINWAKSQDWYQEPFWLTGHSLGTTCCALYTKNYPDKIRALALISAMVSGKLCLTTEQYKNTWQQWKKTGWIMKKTNLGLKKLKWSHMQDRIKYNLLTIADKLIMPVLLIVGTKDTSTPLEHQRKFYEKLPGKEELHVIKEAPHVFTKKEHLQEIEKIFSRWINSILK